MKHRVTAKPYTKRTPGLSDPWFRECVRGSLGVAWTRCAPRSDRSPGVPAYVAGAVLVGASLLLGWLIEPLAGVVVFAVVVAVAVVAYLARRTPTVSRCFATRRTRPIPRVVSPGRHVLVVANETLSGDDLRERIAGSGVERVMVAVLAPVRTPHAHYAVSDIDREREEARVRRNARWRGRASTTSGHRARSAIQARARRWRTSCAASVPTRRSS